MPVLMLIYEYEDKKIYSRVCRGGNSGYDTTTRHEHDTIFCGLGLKKKGAGRVRVDQSDTNKKTGRVRVNPLDTNLTRLTRQQIYI